MSMAQQSAPHSRPRRSIVLLPSLVSFSSGAHRASSGPSGGFRRARPGVASRTSSQCQLPIRLRQRVQQWSGDGAMLTQARERDSPASFTFPRLGAATRMCRDSVSPCRNGNERERAKPSRQ
jgi:hypothetical protein